MLVLALSYYQDMYNTTQLWIQTGIATATQDKRRDRHVPVHAISESLGGVLHEAQALKVLWLRVGGGGVLCAFLSPLSFY